MGVVARCLTVPLCLAAMAAHAGPPFLTDDPEPVDAGHAEINAIYQETRSSDGRAGVLSGEVNYGCARETQCHVALPAAFDRPGAGPLRVGLGDVELGVKYRFLHDDDPGWSAAVYPTVTLPTGDAPRGLGNGRAQLLLPLWVQRTVGPWSLDAGVGWLANPARDARDSWFAGLLAQRSFGDQFSLGAEVFRKTSPAPGVPNSCGFNVGAIANLAPHHNLLFSAGRGLSGVQTNRRSVFLAYQLEL
ncbi:MAG TPA: transporter [Burkholderiaceae bacterium]|jgi:hypothetical protein|nr:transporter [Burkholderiaceae bacterium]